MIVKGLEKLTAAADIFSTHNFPLQLVERLTNGDYQSLKIISGPTKMQWPDGNPIEDFEEVIVSTPVGEVERSSCHFKKITSRKEITEERIWRSLNIGDDGLDFIYISRPKYADVIAYPVNPKTQIV